MMDALGQAEAGDLVLLHGCCHNPTGADLAARSVARRGRPRRGARAHPVRRPRLSGLRRRARSRCGGHAAGRRGGRAGAGRAELRQEFQLLSRPARHAVRQGLERRGRRRSRSAICSGSPGRCGRCRPIIRPPSPISSSTTRSFARCGCRSWTRCARASARSAPASPPPIRASPISTGRTACSRCCR